MGLKTDGLERFAAVAASHVGDDKVPGLIALVAHGDDVHVEALGTLAVGGGRSSGGRCSGSRQRRSRSRRPRRWLWSARAGSNWMSRSTGAAGAREPPGAAPDGRAAR
jgi:hypothetical protein